mmetsp:Transcript_9343/g.29175  ORF Transcript_9343/g.29175 Transcript_9343/m.29175 type:complete len:247 (-) Transcript_9343:688-1428(-)
MVLQKTTTRSSSSLRRTPCWRCQASARTFSCITRWCLRWFGVLKSSGGVQSTRTCSHRGLTRWSPGPVSQVRPEPSAVASGAASGGSGSKARRRCRAASASVAVTKTHCTACGNARRSSSTVRSTPSCTSTSTSSKTTAPQVRRSSGLPGSSNSSQRKRPGVTTSTSVPAAICRFCQYALWPPVQQCTRKRRPPRAETTRATDTICSARSDVGARTSSLTPPGPGPCAGPGPTPPAKRCRRRSGRR